MDQPIPLNLPSEPNSQRPSIFDGVINVNMNMDNIGGGDLTGVWSQVPPQIMPWGTPASQLPNIIRFTGDINSSTSSSSTLSQSSEDTLRSRSYYKRKSADFGPRISKMLVTEEMMTEQLKNMYISNKMEEPNGNEEAVRGIMSEINSDEELPMLTVCSEIKNMIPVFDPAPPVPRTLLKNMEMPTRALVLWTPPKGILDHNPLESPPLRNTSNDSGSSSESNDAQPETIYAMDN